MSFRIKLFMLGACLMPIHETFASCYNSTSLPNGYGLGNTSDYSSSYCSGTKTMYLCDTDSELCDKVTYCASCSSSTYKHTWPYYYGESCSEEILACVSCTYTTTKPSGSGSGGPSNTSHCSAVTTKYVYSSSANAYISYTDCTACQSGYFLSNSQTSSVFASCPLTYRVCKQCEAGTRKAGTECIACEAGTYSSTTNATACTTCPSATNIYVDSTHNNVASVENGSITSASRANSVNACYLVANKTYYDATGTFSQHDLSACYQDGTYALTGCSTVTHQCTRTRGSYTAQDVQTGSIPPSLSTGGQYCFCATNGKHFYMTDMSSSTTCTNACQSACESIITNNPTMRTNLGC